MPSVRKSRVPLKCCCIWILILVSINQCSTDDGGEITELKPTTTKKDISEEFAHLLYRAGQTKRIHLIAEHTRDGRKLQIEEFLDLESWNQLIQFKWHEENWKDGGIQSLTTQKINVVLLNDQDRKILFQYEPYLCDFKIFNTTSVNTDTDWQLILKTSFTTEADNSAITSRQRHIQTIKSIISTAPNSPYLARLPIGSHTTEAWVFGIAGLWIKAQYPGVGNTLPQQYFKDSDSWYVDLVDANLSIHYYFNGVLLGDSPKEASGSPSKPQELSNAEYESLSLIEVREMKEPHVVDMINVIDADFKFSDRLARDLFKLPIGFNCPSNPIINGDNNFFEAYSSGSMLLELELVATKYSGLRDSSSILATIVKSISIAISKHPLNPNASLTMFHVHEDRFKSIRDFHSRLRYNIHLNGTNQLCDINRLHILDRALSKAMDPIEIQFDNGITLFISELSLDYILDSNAHKLNEMRLINQISVSASKDEFVFESQVPESHENLVSVTDSTGRRVLRKMSIVRVYEQGITLNKIIPGKRNRRGSLKLSRIIVLIYDFNRIQKLAELRFNFIKKLQPMSFTRRASNFDISPCYNLEEESIQLLVSYPVVPNLIEYAQSRGHDLVEEFYRSPIDWRNFVAKDDEYAKFEKRRMGLSLNFLRMPKVELKNTADGELALHLMLLDKPSPIHLFDQVVESTFMGKTIDERLLVESAEKCAKFCQQFRCKMFAFDSRSRECKLSPLSIQDNHLNEDSVASKMEDRENFVKPIRQSFSKVYSAPPTQVDPQDPVDDASLIELLSYIEHSSDELDNFHKEVEDEEYSTPEDTDNNNISREKRGTSSIQQWPLLSFRFTDRSGSEYAPPKMRLLVPSEIKMLRVPITLDVSGQSQENKVASAFRSQVIGKAYQLNVLDNWDDVPAAMLIADERTFIGRSSYFTLKRLQYVEMETCTLMCYNIIEWDHDTASEQTCVSFSYCSKDKQCVLVIKTDFNFTRSIYELAEQGDLVHSINSTDQLLREDVDCTTSSRNYLTSFEGPIRLAPNFYAEKSTKDVQFGLEYEWLTAIRVESNKLEVDNDEMCAKQCFERNKTGKKCLALDYCTTQNERPLETRKTRFGNSCHLFLIHDAELGDKSKIFNEIGHIRSQLTQLTRPKEKGKLSGKVVEISNCNRYLVSHLSEFTHIKQRQISDELSNLLEVPIPTMNNINLDNCALECALRRSECLAFEYCSKIDQDTKIVVRNCTHFGGPKKWNLSRGLKSINSTNSEMTKYSDDCTIYLKTEIKSLGDLLNLGEHDASVLSANLNEYVTLILCFLVLYLLVAVGILYYLRSQGCSLVMFSRHD